MNLYKANIELFTVKSNFKVKFSLILKADDNNENYKKLVNKFKINGNEYLQVSPYPFITFDISSKKDRKENGYSNYDSVTITRKHLFLLLRKIGKLIKDFTRKDLFYYDDNHELQVNQNLAQNVKLVHQMTHKTILMQPCVVRDEESNRDYEGCFLAINTMDHYTEITYSELQFLYHELSKIDFTSYALQLINMSELFKKEESSEIKLSILQPKEEEVEEEIIDNKSRIRIEEPHEIPEI